MSNLSRRTFSTLALTTALAFSAGVAHAQAVKEIRLDFATYNPVSLLLKERGLLEKEFAADGISIRWVQSLGSNKALEFLNASSIDFGSTAGAGRAPGCGVSGRAESSGTGPAGAESSGIGSGGRSTSGPAGAASGVSDELSGRGSFGPGEGPPGTGAPGTGAPGTGAGGASCCATAGDIARSASTGNMKRAKRAIGRPSS